MRSSSPWSKTGGLLVPASGTGSPPPEGCTTYSHKIPRRGFLSHTQFHPHPSHDHLPGISVVSRSLSTTQGLQFSVASPSDLLLSLSRPTRVSEISTIVGQVRTNHTPGSTLTYTGALATVLHIAYHKSCDLHCIDPEPTIRADEPKPTHADNFRSRAHARSSRPIHQLSKFSSTTPEVGQELYVQTRGEALPSWRSDCLPAHRWWLPSTRRISSQ